MFRVPLIWPAFPGFEAGAADILCCCSIGCGVELGAGGNGFSSKNDESGPILTGLCPGCSGGRAIVVCAEGGLAIEVRGRTGGRIAAGRIC
jgi:hypothetical protein